jgi:hypothetical protein
MVILDGVRVESFTDLYGDGVGGPSRMPLYSGGTRIPTFESKTTQPRTSNMNKFTTLAAGVALAVASLGAFAQAAAPATPRVDQRQANQQARIDAGVASGQLNARETNRLDKQQARIAATEAKDKADGTVTAKERRQLHRMQNRASKNIYAQKHDAQVAPKP